MQECDILCASFHMKCCHENQFVVDTVLTVGHVVTMVTLVAKPGSF